MKIKEYIGSIIANEGYGVCYEPIIELKNMEILSYLPVNSLRASIKILNSFFMLKQF
ncbi:hypothetical protein LCX93_09510 [Sulfurimonas sp. SWIR-19]|uniref:hypothetical protein n=1 Tax=Sulfurimonas sp. SWIR-19 TaxID=2878390 RepID=UPI001CF3402A|nr:hypothetical protein [Sulfurimonas sp. SWIR-19]UCM99757.1 hypothetical protein LCX93_09510 [Sulfurimonas sp. SWIR-19]